MPRYQQWKKYLCYSQDNLDRVKKLWVVRKVFSTTKDLFIQKRVSLKAILEEDDILLIYLASKRTRPNISELIIGIRYALRVGGKGTRVVKQRQLDSCKVSPASKYRRRVIVLDRHYRFHLTSRRCRRFGSNVSLNGQSFVFKTTKKLT